MAIVTGAGSGIGRAIAQVYAEEGAKVIVADRNVDNVRQVLTEIMAKGGTATGVLVDVSMEEAVSKMIEIAVKNYGTVDIVVNNAGIMDNFLPIETVTDATWEKVMAVNVTGPMRIIRKVMPMFLEKKSGVIINVASIGGLQGSRAGVAYTASKHAMIGMTKNIGFQYAKLGIRCNAIAPGGVNTNIGTTMSEPDKFGMERAMAGIAANIRSAEPIEIAKVALFLASDDASFVNGEVIVADAGWTAY